MFAHIHLISTQQEVSSLARGVETQNRRATSMGVAGVSIPAVHLSARGKSALGKPKPANFVASPSSARVLTAQQWDGEWPVTG